MFKSDIYIVCADTQVKWIHSGQIQLSGVFSWEYKRTCKEKMDTTNYTTTNSTMNVNN